MHFSDLVLLIPDAELIFDIFQLLLQLFAFVQLPVLGQARQASALKQSALSFIHLEYVIYHYFVLFTCSSPSS